MPPPTATTRVRPGDGLLLRAADLLLFIPEADASTDALTTAFATPDPAAALAEALVASDFAAPAFALITWKADIELMVFGPIEVSTDQPAMPMLSGAGSQTWVEHRLRHNSEVVRIDVAPPDDETTDLRDGTVPAGGFSVSITTGIVAEPIPQPEDAPAEAPPAAAVAEAPPAEEPVPEAPPVESPPAPPVSAPDAPPPPPDGAVVQSSPAPGLDDLPPPPVPDIDLDQLPPPPVPFQPAPPPAVDELPPPAATDLVDLPPPTASDPEATIIAGDSPDAQPLIEAKTCANCSFFSPPFATVCRACGAALPPGDQGVHRVVRPSLGSLVFDDGTTIELDRSYEVGRQPEPDSSDIHPVAITGAKVSRRHAKVIVRDWDVLIEDLGSRNGTTMLPTGAEGEDPVLLSQGMPVAIEPGAIVHLGSSYFVYVTEPAG
ncbi:MAG: FHA domain-containing protein [Actinomycetota bacterium]